MGRRIDSIGGGVRGLGSALADLGREWASRHAGRRHVPDDIRHHARDVAGVTGFLYSKGWDQVAGVRPGYLRSFDDPTVPPSLHISARDRRRRGSIVPLVERCIEDHARPESERPGPWSTEELTADRRGRRRRRGAPPGHRRPPPG